MKKLVFNWNQYNSCWECISPRTTKIFIHKYPPTDYLVSIQKKKEPESSHIVLDSIHAVQVYIELKYTGTIKYRDPHEFFHIQQGGLT